MDEVVDDFKLLVKESQEKQIFGAIKAVREKETLPASGQYVALIQKGENQGYISEEGADMLYKTAEVKEIAYSIDTLTNNNVLRGMASFVPKIERGEELGLISAEEKQRVYDTALETITNNCINDLHKKSLRETAMRGHVEYIEKGLNRGFVSEEKANEAYRASGAYSTLPFQKVLKSIK